MNVDLYAQAEALPLRRELVRQLIYLRDHKIKGTQNQGNLLRRAIWEVTSQLTNPPVLEETFGKQPYKAQNEMDVRPLQFLSILSKAVDLLTGALSGLLQITRLGEQLIRRSPPVQIW